MTAKEINEAEVMLRAALEEVERLEQWLKLIRERARGMASISNSDSFTAIAKWADAALREERR